MTAWRTEPRRENNRSTPQVAEPGVRFLGIAPARRRCRAHRAQGPAARLNEVAWIAPYTPRHGLPIVRSGSACGSRIGWRPTRMVPAPRVSSFVPPDRLPTPVAPVTYPNDSDEELVGRIRAGDRDALGALYDRHAGTALAVALRIVADRDEAEDIVHDAFVAAWRSIATFDPARGGLASWLVRLVRNRAIDGLRARRTTPGGLPTDLPPVVVDDPNPTWQATVDRMTAAEIRDALERLPAEQRQAIELAYFGGYTYRDVARLTGVSPGTASSRLRLGLAKLRASLASGRTAALALPNDDVEEPRR